MVERTPRSQAPLTDRGRPVRRTRAIKRRAAMASVVKLVGVGGLLVMLMSPVPLSADGLAGRWIGAVQMGKVAPRLLFESLLLGLLATGRLSLLLLNSSCVPFGRQLRLPCCTLLLAHVGSLGHGSWRI